MTCSISQGTPLSATCPDCSHPVAVHTYPKGECSICNPATPPCHSLTYNSWVGTMADCMSNEEFTDTERDLASFVHAALTLGQMTPELASWLDQRGLEALENTDGD